MTRQNSKPVSMATAIQLVPHRNDIIWEEFQTARGSHQRSIHAVTRYDIITEGQTGS